MLHGKSAGVASFDTPKAIGEPLGKVTSIKRQSFSLDKPHSLSAGDGICILSPKGMCGTNINRVEGKEIFPNKMEGIEAGAKGFRNYDHRFTTLLDNSRTRRTIDARAELHLSDEGCTLSVTDEQGVTATIEQRTALDPSSNAEKMEATACRLVAKSGDTIFSVSDVKVQGAEYFAPASLLSQMRREVLDQLLAKRKAAPRHHKILPDTGEARYPYPMVTRYENVTNAAAERFYRRHGAKLIEPALESQPTKGERVMISSYCLRREIGECLKQKPSLKGDLYIEHGTARYKLEFDCRRCLMMLIDHTLQKQ
jgi:putative protease